MKWYRREKKLAALDLDVIGNRAYVSGDTYYIKNQLMGMGFRWDGRSWSRDWSSIQSDPTTMNALRGMGIAVETPPSERAIVQPPRAPAPSQIPPRKPVPGKPVPGKPVPPTARPTWVLARENETGALVALRKSPEGRWQYVVDPQHEGPSFGRLAGGGFVSEDEAKSIFTSIKGADGKPIRGMAAEILIEEYRRQEESMNVPTEPESEEEAREKDGEDLPAGRMEDKYVGPYQKDIQDTFLETKDNIMMNALAGTGKTTMLAHLASFKPPGEKWLYLVFNKKNAAEANESGKFPRGMDIMTSHSFVGGVLRKSGNFPTDINMNRHGKLIDDMFKGDDTFPREFWFSAKQVVSQLSDLAKNNGVLPTDPNAVEDLRAIIGKWSVDTDLSTEKAKTDRDWTPEILEKTMEVLQRSLPGQAGTGNPKIDGARNHDDTLWYGARLEGVSWPRYDVVLADEVQDFNKNQQVMLQALADRGARVVAVGDPNQAIYMFRGADSSAFSNVAGIVGGREGGHNLPTNYRCSKAIIDFVRENTHVDTIRASEAAEKRAAEGDPGMVTNMQIPLDGAVEGLASEWEAGTPDMLDMETAIIARTNKPLVDTALNLLRNGVDFQIIGVDDLAKELVKAVKQVTGTGRYERHFPVEELPGRMQDKLMELEDLWRGKVAKKDKLNEFKGMVETMTHIVDYLRSLGFEDEKVGMRVATTEDLIGSWPKTGYLQKKFAPVDMSDLENKRDPRSYVALTTAHRSKGLEFDRVYIAEPDLFPHPRAKSEEELGQEANAWYVALTRAKNELHVLVPTPKDEDRELEATREWVHGNLPGLKKESKRVLENWVTQNCRLLARN